MIPSDASPAPEPGPGREHDQHGTASTGMSTRDDGVNLGSGCERKQKPEGNEQRSAIGDQQKQQSRSLSKNRSVRRQAASSGFVGRDPCPAAGAHAGPVRRFSATRQPDEASGAALGSRPTTECAAVTAARERRHRSQQIAISLLFVAQSLDGIEPRGLDGGHGSRDHTHQQQHADRGGDRAGRDPQVKVAFFGGILEQRPE